MCFMYAIISPSPLVYSSTRFLSNDLKMRYVAAYLLASYGGKVKPTASDLEKILSSVGIECHLAKVKKVIVELNGKSIDEVIALGQGKLASVPSGGAVTAPTAASGGAAALPVEGKKEEKKKEELAESESDDDMGFGLLDLV
ncbi:60S acidic ribosomal protein P2-like [Harmonia axyridis]|uniref:60S acidic ribosomal protein P2-like n=1 Tax=Harmonia axyridis TaxID=115357 RepID=UPI001E2764B8|nr:60S acidic ribosomal protein P2-like [Harmonia axyridis]